MRTIGVIPSPHELITENNNDVLWGDKCFKKAYKYISEITEHDLMREKTFMKSASKHLDKTTANRICFTFLLMLALMGIIHFASIPNPEMILFTAMVIITNLFGKECGIVCIVELMLYVLFFYSARHHFFLFDSGADLGRVAVTAYCCFVSLLFFTKMHEKWNASRLRIVNKNKNLQEYSQSLKEESRIDELTGLYNRVALRDKYSSYVNKNLIVTFLDLDDFKKINDTFGHEVGDLALQEVSRTLRTCFRNTDCYRYGGDEFLLIRLDDNWTAYEMEVLRIRQHLLGVKLGNLSPTIHLSGGYIIGIPKNGSELRSMFHEADEMLYESKHKGKNCFTGNAVLHHLKKNGA